MKDKDNIKHLQIHETLQLIKEEIKEVTRVQMPKELDIQVTDDIKILIREATEMPLLIIESHMNKHIAKYLGVNLHEKD